MAKITDWEILNYLRERTWRASSTQIGTRLGILKRGVFVWYTGNTPRKAGIAAIRAERRDERGQG